MLPTVPVLALSVVSPTQPVVQLELVQALILWVLKLTASVPSVHVRVAEVAVLRLGKLTPDGALGATVSMVMPSLTVAPILPAASRN